MGPQWAQNVNFSRKGLATGLVLLSTKNMFSNKRGVVPFLFSLFLVCHFKILGQAEDGGLSFGNVYITRSLEED